MADHQRIHPVDLEAGRNRPSAPLVPSGSFQSDKGDPAQRASNQQQQHQQRGHGGYGHGPLPPPPRRVAPPLPPPKRRGRGCCCRFLCCVVATAVVLAVLAAAAAAALYLIFKPQAPRYSVDRLAVSAFQVDPSTLTARAAFDVTVTAANPNARIGIHYGRGSSLSVWYGPYPLARGALPAFYQGRRNTTVLAATLHGYLLEDAYRVSDTYRIRIRVRYTSDTYPRSIRFFLFSRNSDTCADTYRFGGHGVSAFVDTAQPNKKSSPSP